MRAKYLTAALIGSTLMIAPAFAQNMGGSSSQPQVNASSRVATRRTAPT